MVPSNKCLVIALLVAVAVVSPSLQPSAAIRFPPIIPCIPGLPRIPFLPCYEAPPSPPLKHPTECWTPLTKMMPCAGFVTNNSELAPSRKCCEGFDSIGNDGGAICYCRVASGDIAQLLPAPLNFTRLFSLPTSCGIDLRLQGVAKYCNMDHVPPMTRPSPPPSP